MTLPRMSTCGKLSYPSEHAARQARGYQRNKGARMRVYYCSNCRAWHLTTQSIEFRDGR